MWRRYMSTTQDNESAAAQGITIDVGLRAVLQYRYGVVNAANPLTEGAKVLGYENEYDMVFQLLTAGAGAVQKKKAVKGTPGRETTDDAKVPDDELLLVLSAMLEDEPAGVRGPDWFRELSKNFDELGGRMSMTKDGFYARIKKLVAGGQVKAVEVKVPQKLYGRDVMANVTLYSLPAEVPAKEGGVA